MSLFYQVVFPQDAPELEPLIYHLANEWGPTITVVRGAENQFFVLQNGEWLLDLTILSESDYLELSFGEYHYRINWYIVLGKIDRIKAQSFYLEIVRGIVTSFPNDFLSLFNGERVVLKREKGILYLNTESGVWENQDNLSLLGKNTYTMATYPVNY